MTFQFTPVTDTDREALVDFMFAHAPIMMFPLTNLTRYGLGADHPRAIRAWVAKDGKDITDVLTISQEGMVFPCCPTGQWDAAAAILQGHAVKGFLGEGEQVAALRAAANLTGPARLDTTEPSYLLTLATLRMPDVTDVTLRPLSAAPFDLLVQWRSDYDVETLSIPRSEAHLSAHRHVRQSIAQDSHRVLFAGDTPVAMTGFNAILPEIVQVGGVYTPPAHRNKAYARKALALHLAEVAVDGVTDAVLSAANDYAARAYLALGFEQIGTFALVIYDDPQVVHG